MLFSVVFSSGGTGPSEASANRRAYLKHPDFPRLFVLGAVVATLALAEHYSSLYFRNVVDDAATSLQYAKNFALGRGLVFNPGERVEGYTNFLWVVIEAPLYLVSRVTGGNFVSLVVHANVLIAGAVVAVVGSVVRRLTDSALLPLILALGLCVLDNSFTCWAAFALENHLLALTFLGAIWFAALPHPRRYLRVGLCLAAAHMTRPDAGLFAAVLLTNELIEAGCVAFGKRRDRAAAFGIAREAVLAGAVWVGVFGVYFAWRYSYYGYPFPNTYYLKLGGEIDAWARGGEYVQSFFAERAYLPLGSALALIGIRDRTLRGIVLYLLLHTTYVAYVGGDFFSGHRFFVAQWPLFAIACGAGVFLLLRTAELPHMEAALLRVGLSAEFFAGGLAFAVLATLVVTWTRGLEFGPLALEIRPWRENLRKNKELALWFKANTRQDASIATCLIGHTGLFSERRIIDLCGVIDPVIAHKRVDNFGHGKAGHEKKATAEYLLGLRPTYVIDGYVAADYWERGYFLSAAPPPQSITEVWERDTLKERARREPDGAFHFETIEAGWTRSGKAFADAPGRGARPGQGTLHGAVGGLVNSFHPTLGDRATGTLRSPPFQILGDRITLRVAGGHDAKRLRVSLSIDGERVFNETGRTSDRFTRRQWDTQPYRGKSAVLEVVDEATESFGYIALDEVEQWSLGSP
jgi:hypothetical protein